MSTVFVLWLPLTPIHQNHAESEFELKTQLPRQICLRSGVYSLRPSFVMSYMTSMVEQLESGMLLLSVNTPCWVVTQVCGHNDMFWYSRGHSG